MEIKFKGFYPKQFDGNSGTNRFECQDFYKGEGTENLEAVVLSLGDIKSGIYESINEEVNRHFIKHNGSLIYQQLFNGKVIVLIQYPMIENYGKPKPPKTIAIYRPDEIKEPYIVRHMETLISEVTNWEDYDDDEPSQKIGFHLNFEKEE